MNKKLHELGKMIVACETYIIHDGKVLMHKWASNKKKFPGFWIGPGGHVNEGEDVLTCAIREVAEESGVLLNEKNIQLKVLAYHHHLDRGEVWIEYLFRANIPKTQKIKSTSEGSSVWIDIKKLKTLKNIFPPSKYYFKHIFDDESGILYNFSQWRDAKLVKVLSERVVKSG